MSRTRSSRRSRRRTAATSTAAIEGKDKGGGFGRSPIGGLSMRINLVIVCSAVIAALATASCSGLNTPTAQSVAGLPPSGSVTITEDFVAGLGGGRGTLQYEGRSYPFKVLGS